MLLGLTSNDASLALWMNVVKHTHPPGGLCQTSLLLHTSSMKQRVPDKTQMRRYLERKLTQQQIVDEWEKDSNVKVTRSAIAMAIKRYDLESSTPRARFEDLLPWRVSSEHRMHFDARMLRLEARRRRGGIMTEDEEKMLSSWLLRLKEQNAVVTYVPETHKGFWHVERQESDGDSLIRS